MASMCVCVPRETGLILPLTHFIVLLHPFIVLSFLIIFLIIFLSVRLLLQSLRLLLHPALVLKSENRLIHHTEHAQVFALNILDLQVIMRIGNSIALAKMRMHWKQRHKKVHQINEKTNATAYPPLPITAGLIHTALQVHIM